jgi:hypothetical protein
VLFFELGNSAMKFILCLYLWEYVQ